MVSRLRLAGAVFAAGLVLMASACAIDARQVGVGPDEAAQNQAASAETGGSGPGSAGRSSASGPASVTSQGGAGSGGLGVGAGAGGSTGGGGARNASPTSAGGGAGLGSGMPSSTEPSAAVDGPCEPRLAAPTLVSTDEVYATLAADLALLPEGAQPFTRYVGLTNRSNAGAPACELDAERNLLGQVLNAASAAAVVPPPLAAVDARQLIYRIDLRDYGWDRGVNSNGSDFVDAWEAIAASSPFAVSFVGDAADDATNDSGSTVPFLYSSALIEQVLAGVPPAPAAPLQALRSDPLLSPTLARLNAPVTIADVAGDLALGTAELTLLLPLLDPGLQPLAAGGTLPRTAYAPLFVPSLCLVSVARENQVFSDRCSP